MRTVLAVVLVLLAAPAPQAASVQAEDPVERSDELVELLESPPPPRPELPAEAAARAEALREAQAAAQARFVETGDPSDLEEAVARAREELALRRLHQVVDGGDGEWWEVGDARRRVEELERMADWTSEELERAGRLQDLEREIERLFAAGDYGEYVRLLEEVLGLRSSLFGAQDDTTAKLQRNHAWGVSELGSRVGAIAELQEVHALQLRALGEGHPEPHETARYLARLLISEGRSGEARALLERALPGLRAALGDDATDTALALETFGRLLILEGRVSEAVSVLRLTLGAYERTAGPDSLEAFGACLLLSEALVMAGELDGAEALLRKAVEGVEQYLPEERTNWFVTRQLLLDFLRNHRGQVRETLPESAALVEDSEQALGEDHPLTRMFAGHHGQSLVLVGEHAEAVRFLRRALADPELLTAVTDRASIVRMRSDLAAALRNLGRLGEAEALGRTVLAENLARLGAENQTVLFARDGLARTLESQGRLDEAVEQRREAWERSRSLLGEDDRWTLIRERWLAGVLDGLGRVMRRDGDSGAELAFEEAVALSRAAWERSAEVFGRTHPDTIEAQREYGDCLVGARRFGEGVEVAEASFRTSQELHGTDPAATWWPRAQWATGLLLAGDTARAAEVAAPLADAVGGEDPWEQRFLHSLRAELALREGRLDEAVEEAERGIALALSVRRSVSEDAALRSAVDDRLGLHELGGKLTALHALRGDAERAWEAFEETKGRVLLELLASAEDAAAELELAGFRELHAGLEPGELLVGLLWSEYQVVVLSLSGGAPPERAGIARAVATDEEGVLSLGPLAARVAEGLRSPTGGRDASDAARELAERLFDPPLRRALASARRVVLVPDGPLADLPLEGLAELAGDALEVGPVAYATSGGVYLDRRAAAERASGRRLVALGDPRFAPRDVGEPVPEQGLMLTSVTPGGAADAAGLGVGDVLVAYAGRSIGEPNDLRAAIGAAAGSGEATVPVEVWRAGRTLETEIAPGSLGVYVDFGNAPADALARMQDAERTPEERRESAERRRSLRSFGALTPLPGTRREVEGIAALAAEAEWPVRILLDAEATRSALEAELEDVRWLHLATHGRPGTRAYPYSAGLALAAEASESTETAADVLSLRRILEAWGGRLEGCELVTLSACDTQRGARRGASSLALPWGLFSAGATTVVASLWKVDDAATSLLMRRFYANLLRDGGGTGKLEALVEAREWLRGLTRADLERLEAEASASIGSAPTRGLGLGAAAPSRQTERPYAHPYYWSGFVLVGDPG